MLRVILAVAILMLFGANPVPAQQGNFEDLGFLKIAINRTLEFNKVGEVSKWQNPATGNAGLVVPLKTFRATNGQNCRAYRRYWVTADVVNTYEGNACRVGRVAWRVEDEDLVKRQTLAEAKAELERQDGSGEGGERPVASGTGFVVSRDGYILTNNHVIEGCGTITAGDRAESQVLSLVATDRENDLALLRLSRPLDNVAVFRSGRAVRLGDGVVAIGYPLRGLLGSGVNVTVGTVTAMNGIDDDSRFLQTSAPVQPGNSGGPLLDQSGNVVGVVSSKLNALVIAEATGDIPQNINFAIKADVVRVFLDSHGVDYLTKPSTQTLSNADVGELGDNHTLPIECYSSE